MDIAYYRTVIKLKKNKLSLQIALNHQVLSNWEPWSAWRVLYMPHSIISYWKGLYPSDKLVNDYKNTLGTYVQLD